MGKLLQIFCQNSGLLFLNIPYRGFKGIKYLLNQFIDRENKVEFIKDYFTKDRIYLFNRADIRRKIKNGNSVILIRDPRDICISAANYDGKDTNDDPKDKDFYRYKEHVKNMSFEEKVLFQASNTSLQTIKRLEKFIDNNNCLVIKYEDLFLDIDNDYVVLEQIFNYLNFNEIDRKKFKSVYNFIHLKNYGKTSHSNSGQPKQYNQLSPKTLEIMNGVLEQYISKFKYFID